MSAIDPRSRRAFIVSSIALTVVGLAGRVARAADHGLLKPPLPVPNLPVVLHDGASTSLPFMAMQHVTALQLMFTTCTSTCPMQGAIFERVQTLMPDMLERKIQLVSLSVDPKNDTPKALAAWLRHFQAGPGWIGAAPALSNLDEVKVFFGAGRNILDPHSTQVHIIDRRGNVVWRTYELPPAEEIVGVLKRV